MKKKTLIPILLQLIVLAGYSQNLLTNNSLIAIDPNTPIMVEGGVFNTGSILNEGDLRLTGDWSNSGDYSSVSGTFTLNGDNQMFDPGNSTYNHLAINSPGVVVINDLQITESLALVSGILSVATDAKILLRDNASIVGGNDNSYIDGALFTTATGDFTFPVGTEFEYLPVTLSNIQSNDSVGVRASSDEISASLPKELDSFSPNRYWEILGSTSFSAEGIQLPIIEESFIESFDDAVIAFAEQFGDPLSIVSTPILDGSLNSGTIRSMGSIHSGFYVVADKSLVGPPITVINVITTLQDGKHDFLRIENIEFYENNLVEIFDRQGVKVFEMSGYNNTDRVFRGSANVGPRGELTTGNYYYTVQLTSSKREAGFIYIKN